MRVLHALLIVLAIGCSSRGGNDAELEKSATQAMAELNAADATFPRQIADALTTLVARPSGAADAIKTTILPLMDRYLATMDRAIATADAYLATKNDEESKRALETIRQRAESFRTARVRFAELEQKARAGASVDELGQGIMAIGVMLSTSK